jgi:hypothetical protein
MRLEFQQSGIKLTNSNSQNWIYTIWFISSERRRYMYSGDSNLSTNLDIYTPDFTAFEANRRTSKKA